MLPTEVSSTLRLFTASRALTWSSMTNVPVAILVFARSVNSLRFVATEAAAAANFVAFASSIIIFAIARRLIFAEGTIAEAIENTLLALEALTSPALLALDLKELNLREPSTGLQVF